MLAIAWHVAAAVAMIALAVGRRPSNRDAALLLTLPLASVAVVAFAFANPFNALMFAGLTLALVVLAVTTINRDPIARAPRAARIVGAALVAFGWLYPHFLVGRSAVQYLWAAPLGVIPCPTLAAVTGAALIGRGFGNRAWSWTLALIAGFYALFGMLRLGVWIDAGLLAGAITLLATTRVEPAVKSAQPFPRSG